MLTYLIHVQLCSPEIVTRQTRSVAKITAQAVIELSWLASAVKPVQLLTCAHLQTLGIEMHGRTPIEQGQNETLVVPTAYQTIDTQPLLVRNRHPQPELRFCRAPPKSSHCAGPSDVLLDKIKYSSRNILTSSSGRCQVKRNRIIGVA